MAVLLANATLTLRRRQHAFARDAHGMPVAPAGTFEAEDPLPGNAREAPDRSWRLRLPPQWWPVEIGDEVDDDVGRTFVLTEVRLNVVPGAADVDFVGCRGTLNPPKVP